MTNNNIILNEKYYFQNINLSCTSSLNSSILNSEKRIEICNRNFKFLLFGIDLNISNTSYQSIATLSIFDKEIKNFSRYTFAQEKSDQTSSSKIKFISLSY